MKRAPWVLVWAATLVHAADPATDEHAHHHDHHHEHHAAPEATRQQPETPTISLSAETYQEFQSIQSLARQGDFAAAERKAQALLPRLQNEPLASCLLLRTLAAIHGVQRRYQEAVTTQQRCLTLAALPAAELRQALLELGQYQVAAGDTALAAATLTEWRALVTPATPEQLMTAADLLVRLQRPGEAIHAAEEAIAGAGAAAKLEWYELLLSLYHAEKDYRGCEKALTALIDRAPEEARHWNQLARIYQESGDERRALATRQLMYHRGLIQEPAEIIHLAEVLRSRGMPRPAAELLTRELERGRIEATPANLETLAEAWLQARELRQAAAVLEKSAAAGRKGDTYHRLGQIYSELHDWAKARRALSQALALGQLRDPGGSHLLLGLAHYRLKARAEAQAAFTEASRYANVARTAKQWLDLLQRETSAGTATPGGTAPGRS